MNIPRSATRPGAPALVLVFSAFALVAAACSSTPAAESSAPSEAASANASVAATATPAATATAAPSASGEPGIGSKVKVGDQQYVTVDLVEPWAGTDTQQPAAGNVFVSVKITVTAITTTSFTSADFSVKDGEGMSFQEAPPGRAPHLSFQDGLEPDHFYAGFVTFQVPEASAEKLVLVYAPNFMTETFEWKLFADT